MKEVFSQSASEIQEIAMGSWQCKIWIARVEKGIFLWKRWQRGKI